MRQVEEQQHEHAGLGVECTDIATLDGWLDRALLVASVDELLG